MTHFMTGDTNTTGSSKKFSQADAWIGRQLGKYSITEKIGVGGMGVVFKAHDNAIERDVAIKLLPPEIASDEIALRRFLSEARSAGKLNHPHVVTIHEVASDGNVNYIVMELVTGGSAADHLETTGPYSVQEATRIISEASAGLAAAHKLGLIHRDIKPSNLLLTGDQSVKISDFGLAKYAGAAQTMQMTQAGVVVGTPCFMSPEQCETQPVDARSDVYSLGATYYCLLTGKKPYQDSGSVLEVMYSHCHAERPDPREVSANVPPACADVIRRAMSIDPEERYQTCEEMKTDLEAILAAMSGSQIMLPSSGKLPHKPQRSKRLIWTGLAGVLILLVTAALLLPPLLRSGGNDNSAPSLAQTNSRENPADVVVPPPTGKPIKVGILHSLSGTMSSSESPVVDATLLAIEELNLSGGLLGRPVEAVVADGRSDETVFAREARRLIKTEQVAAVFGCWTSAARKTVVPIVEEFDHLLVYPVQYEGLEESPNVIYTGAAPNQQIIPAVRWAYDFENRRKFFLVGSDYVFPRVANEIIKDLLKELGAELAGEAYLPLGSRDVGPIVKQIVSAQPDVILNTINGDSNQEFFSELRKAGIRPPQIPTISFSIGEAELLQLDPETLAGNYAAWNYSQTIDSPENHKFVSSFQKKYGPQRVVTDPMEAAYFGVHLWANAVKSAESVDIGAVRRELRNSRMTAPEGDVRIDATTQHTFKTPRIGKIRTDGQFDIVWTAAKPVAPAPYPRSRTAEQWRALLNDLYLGWGNRWSALGTK